MAKIPRVSALARGGNVSLCPQERDVGQTASQSPTRCPRGDAAATAKDNKRLSGAAPTPCFGVAGPEAAPGRYVRTLSSSPCSRTIRGPL